MDSVLTRFVHPRMLLFVMAVFAQTVLRAQGGGCDCTNCPQFMPDGFTGNFYINVMNATNPNLGQNGQGVCGVHLVFNHEYLGDLSITLTSPSGQSVNLVGPIGLFGPTDFTNWDVTFLPCGDAVTPDPGFSAVWNNNQPWGLFGTYTGSYYPHTGCLENFNSGSVNGVWTLTVVDGQAVDVGNFINYEIIFCDPSGINCFTCAANAGNLLQNDVSACQGSPNLSLNLPPTYAPPNMAPPAPDYSYTYIVSGPGGVIQAYEPGPDLTAYDPGAYTVCGLSYLTVDEGDFPPPNGSLTIAQLSAQLNSTSPPFCGKITANCVNVTILAVPQNVEETDEICGPNCFMFYGQNYCQSGDYIRNLTQNGCPYTATLHLTVHQPNVTFLNETICSGGCSQNPSFPLACSQGNFQALLQNQFGCDSTVFLAVTVLNVAANIVPPATLPCGQNTVNLQGAGSTTGLGTTYLWSAGNGGAIVGNPFGINATGSGPGDYNIRVCRTFAGASCCDSATVNVTQSTNPPDSPTSVNGNSTICFGQTASFAIPPVPGATSYTWTVPPGVTINSGQNGTAINVTWNSPIGGDICAAANNICGPSTPTCLTISVVTPPVPAQPQGNATVCAGSTEAYSIPALTNVTTYTWTVPPPAVIVSGQGTTSIVVDWGPGGSSNLCVKATGLCGTSQPVCLPITINSVPAGPTVTGNLTVCSGTTNTYTVGNIPGATGFNWQITGGTITSGNNTSSVQVVWNNNSTTGMLCASALNSCGESSQQCIDVNIGVAPPAPAIAGDSSLCAGTNGAYTLTAVNGATGYTWSVPAGDSIVSGQNSTSLTVYWSGAPGGTVCAAANSTCGAGLQQCFPVLVHAQPLAHAGVDSAVCGTTIKLTAVPSIAGSSGNWTKISGPGSVSFVNAAKDTTDVTVGQNGVYLLQWAETNVVCTDVDTIQVHFNDSPLAGQIAPDCDPTNQNYSISFPITGGSGPFSITGGTVTGNQFTSNLIPNGQTYTFTITDVNNCISQALSGSFNCNCSTAAGQMNLQPLSACEGGTVTAQHQGGQNLDGNDIASYVLHSNSGTSLGTIFGQNTTGIFGFQNGMVYGTTYYISYVVGNKLGSFPDPSDPCLSVAQGQPVTFYQNPVAQAGADTSTCGQTLSLSGNSGSGTGVWSLSATPPGGSLNIANPQSASTVATASVYGTYAVLWTLDNNGCTAVDTVLLNYNDLPSAGALSETCDGANENYTVSIPIVNGAAPYTVNGNPVAGTNYQSPNFANGATFSFVITDANGCASPPVNGVYNCNCSTKAGQMNLNLLSACEGGSIQALYLGGLSLDANDTISFVLHNGSGTSLGTVFAQNQTGIFTFQPGMSYGTTYYVSAVAGNKVNGLPDPADPCLSVSQGQPVVFYQNPIADAGINNAVCGNTVTLNAVGSGSWSAGSIPGGATILFQDAQSATTTATASKSGIYTLLWTVSINNCIGFAPVDIQFNPIPALDDVQRDCDVANENFTVTLQLSGGTAPYTVNGSQINGNSFTSTYFSNGQQYSFAVTDANGCSLPQIDGAYSCNCSTDAGTMQAQPLTVCEGTTVTVTANSDQHLDGNDVVSFILHSGSGPALGQVFAQNTTGVFGFQNGMSYGQTYYVSLVAGNPQNGFPNQNDPCFSVATGQPVVFVQNPVPDAGVNTSTCSKSIDLQAVNSGITGVWSQVSGPGIATFNTPGSPSGSVAVDQFGSYVFEWKETSGLCSGSDDVTIVFNESPDISTVDELCDATNTTYSISFTTNGGLAPYQISGLSGSFAGNTFTSTAITNNTPYAFWVTDLNNCSTLIISGNHNCNCATDAGSMLTTPKVFCADTPASADWNNNAALDANDVVRFILHNQSGSNVGTVYATSDQAQFAFGPPLQYGVTYYISAIAGNNLGNTVDLNDPCLSVAPGTPVQWKPLPTASLSGDATICAGESTTISFSGTGAYPLSVSYSNGTSVNTLTLTGAAPVMINVAPTLPTTYQLVSVSDGTTPTCTSPLSTAISVQVNQPVHVGIANDPLELCTGTALPIQLSNLLTGADFGGQWTEISQNPSLPGGFIPATGSFLTDNQPAGEYQFNYKLTAQLPCPSEEAVVTVILDPAPIADAGENKTLNCNQVAVSLGGPGTTTLPGTAYKWFLNNNLDSIVGINPDLFTGLPGDYQLVVTSPAGCTASDGTTVNQDSEVPVAKSIHLVGVHCFGENNGQIFVDSIVSTHPPVLVSINGGPLTEQTLYTTLAPGKYVVSLQDANGCEWQSDTLAIKQPPQLTVDLGANLSVTLGDSAIVQAVISLPPAALDTIVWTPLLDNTNAGKPVQRLFPLQSSPLSIEVTDTNGCKVNDRILLVVNKLREIFIPNIIKPESDFNNLLTIYGGRDVAEIEQFQIFDRWGDKIFEAANFLPNTPSVSWSGKYKGQDVTPGVYVYYAVVRFIDDQKILFKGDVTVLR